MNEFKGFKKLVVLHGVHLGVMKLINVDVVGAEPPQALLTGEAHELGVEFLGALLVADPGGQLVVEVVAEFGRDHHFMAAVAQHLGQNLLTITLAISVGGVKKVDAQLQGIFQQLRPLLLGNIAPPVGGHGPDAKADFRELQVGTG